MKKFTLKYDDVDDESGKLTAKEYNSLTQELVALVENTRGSNDDHFIYEGDENNLDLSKAIFYNKTIKNGFNLVLKKANAHQEGRILLDLEIEPDSIINNMPDKDKIFKIEKGQAFLCQFKLDPTFSIENSNEFWNNKPIYIQEIMNKTTIPYQEVPLKNRMFPHFFFDTRNKNNYLLIGGGYYFSLSKLKTDTTTIEQIKQYAKKISFNNTIYPIREYINQANTQRNYGELSNKPYNFSKDDTDINIVPYLNDNVQYYNPFKTTHSINISDRGRKEDKVNKININLLKAIKKPGIYKVKTKILYHYNTEYENIKKIIPPESKLKHLKAKVSVSLKDSNNNYNIFNFSDHKNNDNHVNRFLLYPMLVHGYHNKNKRTHSTFHKIYNHIHPFMRYRSSWLKKNTMPQKKDFSCPAITQESYRSLGLNKFTINEEFEKSSSNTVTISKEYKYNSYYDQDLRRMKDITSKTISFFHGGKEYDGGYLYLSSHGNRLGPIDLLKHIAFQSKSWMQNNFHPTVGNNKTFYESSWPGRAGYEQWFWLIHTGYNHKGDYDARRNQHNDLSFYSWDGVRNYYRSRPDSKCTMIIIKRSIVIPYNQINQKNISLGAYNIKQYIENLNLENGNNFSYNKSGAFTSHNLVNKHFLDYIATYENKKKTPIYSFEEKDYYYDFLSHSNFYNIIDHFSKNPIYGQFNTFGNDLIFTEQTIPLPLDRYNSDIKDIIETIEFQPSTSSKIKQSDLTLLNLFSEINLNSKNDLSNQVIEDSLKYINGGTKGFVRNPQEKDKISYIIQEHPYYTINSSFLENIKIKTSYNYKTNDSTIINAEKTGINIIEEDIDNFRTTFLENNKYLKYYSTFMYSQGIFIYYIDNTKNIFEEGTENNPKTTKEFIKKIILRYYNEHDDLDKGGLKYIYPIKQTNAMSYQQIETFEKMNAKIKNVEFKKAKQFEHIFTLETFINIFTPNLSYLLDEQLRPRNENISNMQLMIKTFYKLMYDINLEYIYKSKENNGYYGRYLNKKDVEWHKEFFSWYVKTFHEKSKYDFITKTKSIRVKKEEKKDIHSNLIDLKTIKSDPLSKELDNFTIALEDETIIDTDKAGINVKDNYPFAPSSESLEYPLDINIEYEYNQDLLEKDPFYRPKEGRFSGQMTVKSSYKGEYDTNNPIEEYNNKQNLLPYGGDFTRNIETNLEIIKEYT